MSTRKRRCLLLAVVCIFAFAGGIAGSLMTSGLLYAENEKYDVIDDLWDRVIKIERMVKYDEDINSRQGYFHHIQTNYLSSGTITVGTISTRHIDILNKNDDAVASIYAKTDGNPIIRLYSGKQPCSEIIKNEDGEYVSIKHNDPGLIITMHQDEPSMSLYDKDRDERIFFGIAQLEPMMQFYYRSKARLSLGTIQLIAHRTDKKTELEGSVVSFDANGHAIRGFPSLGR